MNKKGSGPVFLVMLILTVLIIVILVVVIGKKDYDEVKEMQETISTGQDDADSMKEAIDEVNDNLQLQYDNLDLELEQ